MKPYTFSDLNTTDPKGKHKTNNFFSPHLKSIELHAGTHIKSTLLEPFIDAFMPANRLNILLLLLRSNLI